VNASALRFELPPFLQAAVPPEARGLPRDGVRLLVLRRGRPLRVHLSTELGGGCWIIEPRAADGSPWGDEPLPAGAVLRIPGAGAAVRVHDTMFAAEPGSAEMPSAGRPFTPRLVRALRARGAGLAGIILHTGVSSHEITSARVEEHPVYPEWYSVPPRTAGAVNATRRRGGRVIAVGTTVVRALPRRGDRPGLPARAYRPGVLQGLPMVQGCEPPGRRSVTEGHLDIVRRDWGIFPRLLMTAFVDPGKQPLPTLNEEGRSAG